MTDLLSRLLTGADALPFAVLRRHGSPELDVLTGDVVDVDALADIPLDGGPVLAAVPYRQIRERGFAACDDGAPMRCLIVRESERVDLDAALALLPQTPAPARPLGFDIPDDEYARIVRRVIDDEIGRGEGANFVISRSFEGQTDAPAVPALLSWLRALLIGESGAYWTFAVHLPAPGGAGGSHPLAMVGATPERHLTVRGGTAVMNPISGTYRHPAGGPTRDGLLAFLADVKESEELFMVVDEEMKMMSAVCPGGGRILGPYLKQMSRLTHTEYLLEGTTDLDVREALRRTLFAPTVTGSPMENACAVIARHEARPRGYYSGVLALFEPPPSASAGRLTRQREWRPNQAAPLAYSLDAPILIRTAYLDEGGRLRVPAGATLVRHSTPEGEVAETRAKASGVLAALGLIEARADASGEGATLRDAAGGRSSGTPLRDGRSAPSSGTTLRDAAPGRSSGTALRDGRSAPSSGSAPAAPLAADAEVAAALAQRNRRLASFWVEPQGTAVDPLLEGRSVLVIDNEDQFTTMLAHQLRHLGMRVRLERWSRVDAVSGDDLVVFGPGPGDPRDLADRRVARLRALLLERARSGAPLVAVCLSHQVLAQLAGFPVEPLPAPRQGVQLEVDVFGRPARIGFYNTFGARPFETGAARPPQEPPFETRPPAAPQGSRVAELRLEASVDAEGVVTALRGPGIASIQGHLESVLSPDGLEVLRELACHALAPAPAPAAVRAPRTAPATPVPTGAR
ncbi:anthranilate synthase family protein [Gryllotalpicola ginsengisoli]|uniref:anthranilate synthase family protein n=1 Tax=Gryllotalpicola ginsengisoli TaxID=444608 RepID=UPI0003B4318D|nr:anthranilate synthase family protein [Gryllotalpicola ginsengisoli]